MSKTLTAADLMAARPRRRHEMEGYDGHVYVRSLPYPLIREIYGGGDTADEDAISDRVNEYMATIISVGVVGADGQPIFESEDAAQAWIDRTGAEVITGIVMAIGGQSGITADSEAELEGN